MRPRRLLRLLSDFDGKIRYHPGKASVMADALSRNERAKPLRMRTFEVWTKSLRIVLMELSALEGEQVLDVSKDEGRLPEAIWFTSTTRNTTLEMGKYSHGLYHKTTKDNKQLRHDLAWEGVIRFSKRGKLNPRYIRYFKILAKVGTLAYRIELPEQLSRVHSTFYVSNLKKYFVDEPLAILLDEIQIDDKLNFIEEPVEIMDREVKRLKQSRILVVKVRWNSR
ncbi:hypothetical protein Tco_1353947 [Tanacetum coccineum]